MKTTITLLLLATLCLTTANAQQAPDNIVNAFAKLYPDAKNIEWEQEDGKYEASFKKKGREISIIFNADATVVATETEIKVSALPAKALEYAKAKGKISEASEIYTGNVITYEAEVNDEDLIFDSNGNFLKSEQEDDED